MIEGNSIFNLAGVLESILIFWAAAQPDSVCASPESHMM